MIMLSYSHSDLGIELIHEEVFIHVLKSDGAYFVKVMWQSVTYMHYVESFDKAFK